MFNLPTELALHILSYLPFDSLSRLQAVSKSWNEFCNLHESSIYRNAAYLNAYIPSQTTMLNELGSFHSQRVLRGVNTWKDLGNVSNRMSAYIGFMLINSQVGSAWRYSVIGKEKEHLLSLSILRQRRCIGSKSMN